MDSFDILGDPVRRRILELLAGGETSAGDLVAAISREFGISQPAVSQHLRLLRESGFALVRPAAQRRLYSLRPGAFDDIEQWLAGFRSERPASAPEAKKKHRKRKKDKAARASLPKLPKRRKAKG